MSEQEIAGSNSEVYLAKFDLVSSLSSGFSLCHCYLWILILSVSYIDFAAADFIRNVLLFRMRDFIGQLMENGKELTQENETLKNESAALVRVCENLEKELQKAEHKIIILKDRVSRI